mmetsp:Transcript_12934/g.27930  ORF Transcript_12934/g.27930 Transcript_12934/m.27930 type:complete len:462 (-) Transcript_12934:130-1515(-)
MLEIRNWHKLVALVALSLYWYFGRGLKSQQEHLSTDVLKRGREVGVPTAHTRAKHNHQFPHSETAVDSLFHRLPACQENASVHTFSRTRYALSELELVDDLKPHFYRMPHFDQLENEISGPVRGGVAIFANAYLEGEFAMIFDCHMVYFPGGCRKHLASKNKFHVSKLMGPNQHIENLHTVVLLSQYWGDAFYHALVENLPRIAYTIDFLRTHSNASILAYKSLARQGANVYNPLLGLENRWVAYNPRKLYHIQRLLVPTATACGSAQAPAIMVFQKESNYSRIGVSPITSDKKPTIVLQKRASRGLTNHQELLQALSQLDCCHVVEFMGTELYSDAITMHRHATIVVAPHGAGLSHAIFMKHNTSAIVEIHPKVGNFNGTGVNYCHQRTARAAGVLSRILVMKKHSVPFGQAYPVEDVSLVVQLVQELLKQVTNCGHQDCVRPKKGHGDLSSDAKNERIG